MSVRDKYLRARYGITEQEYEIILASQGGTCGVCRRAPFNRRLSVDHKHVHRDKLHRGKECRPRVRGLLCWRCNTALPKLQDNADLFRKAATYLDTMPAQSILQKAVNTERN